MLYIIFILGLALRLLFIFYFPQPEVIHDASQYDTLGISIIQGKGFSFLDGIPTARREPLYPLFLAIIYSIFGHSYLAARIFQAILGALMCVFIYFIGKKIFGKNCGLLASIFCALYPHFIVTTGFLLTETLFIFLLSISMLFLINGLEKRKFLLLSGIFLGLSTLTRSITILLPFFLGISFFILMKKKEAIINFLIISICMGLMIIPWTIRNYIRFNTFIPMAIGGGITFWGGTYIPWDGDAWEHRGSNDMEKIISSCPSEIEADRKLYQEGFKNIRENPFGYAKLCIKKLYRFWFWIPGGKQVLKPYPRIKIFLAIMQYSVIFLSLLGIVLSFRKWRLFFPILTIIIYFTLLHTLFFVAIPRYALPIFPYVLLFSANGFLFGLKNFKK